MSKTLSSPICLMILLQAMSQAVFPVATWSNYMHEYRVSLGYASETRNRFCKSTPSEFHVACDENNSLSNTCTVCGTSGMYTKVE